MAAIDRVRIMVLGDSGVGKSSLVQLICHGEVTNDPSYTIGCSVEVKLHEYKAGTHAERTYFVELWETGGSKQHENSRYIFWNVIHGIILVYDLTNKKSHSNLRKWLCQALNKEDDKESKGDLDSELFAENRIPILLIGTKVDMAQSLRDNILSRRSSLAEEYGVGQISMDCKQKKYLAPGSTNSVKMSKFFDKVIERRFYSKISHGLRASTPSFEKRRTSKLPSASE
ncbi:rab-like protein 3 isoform X2 [Argonauta hians]